MILLEQIEEISKREYPDDEGALDATRLLHTWGSKIPLPDLELLLETTGLNATKMVGALAPLLKNRDPGDRDLVNGCLARSFDGCATGLDFLAALANAPSHRITQALMRAGLRLDALNRQLGVHRPPRVLVPVRRSSRVDLSASPLPDFCQDLTLLASKGEFRNLCERPHDLSRLLMVLERAFKRNALLLGPGGVGKTSLVELLAKYVKSDRVSPVLAGTQIFSLSVSGLLGGTKYRGDFEKRFESLMKELERYPRAVLFIDEFHCVFGAGRVEGAVVDLGNLLKPHLTKRGLRFIGATTYGEYLRTVATDKALARRFQIIDLGKSSPALVAQMVANQAEALGTAHGLRIPRHVVDKAIELTDRHGNGEQPDKSVDLIDSASVLAIHKGHPELLPGDLLQTLSEQTGKPVSTLTDHATASLLALPEKLKKRVLGQDRVLDRIARTLIHRRLEAGVSGRNLATFLFAGETGVGKSETALALAPGIFGDEKAVLQLMMGQYANRESLNSLIGAPPAYVGYQPEGGILTRWLHAHGSGVLLFDEIDRAHEVVLLAIQDLLDGRITSANGDVLNVTQCVVILTTNALKPRDLDRVSSIGFLQSARKPTPAEHLLPHFLDSFLGRLDDILVFQSLGREELRGVMKLRLSEALAYLDSEGIRLIHDEDQLLDHLLGELQRSMSGARGIRRLLEKELLEAISQARLRAGNPRDLCLKLDGAFYLHGEVKVVTGVGR